MEFFVPRLFLNPLSFAESPVGFNQLVSPPILIDIRSSVHLHRVVAATAMSSGIACGDQQLFDEMNIHRALVIVFDSYRHIK